MLGYTILIISLFITLLLYLILSKLNKNPIFAFPLFITCIPLLLSGTFLVFSQGSNLTKGLNERNWLTVEGTIIRSEIVGKRAIQPEIEYEYFVNDIKHRAISNLKVPMFGGKRKKFDVARELTNQYSAGKKIIVYYNPKKPSQSTITPGVAWNVYIKLGLGVILFMVSFFGIISPHRKKQ